jgi:hypothetical protein
MTQTKKRSPWRSFSELIEKGLLPNWNTVLFNYNNDKQFSTLLNALAHVLPHRFRCMSLECTHHDHTFIGAAELTSHSQKLASRTHALATQIAHHYLTTPPGWKHEEIRSSWLISTEKWNAVKKAYYFSISSLYVKKTEQLLRHYAHVTEHNKHFWKTSELVSLPPQMLTTMIAHDMKALCSRVTLTRCYNQWRHYLNCLGCKMNRRLRSHSWANIILDTIQQLPPPSTEQVLTALWRKMIFAHVIKHRFWPLRPSIRFQVQKALELIRTPPRSPPKTYCDHHLMICSHNPGLLGYHRTETMIDKDYSAKVVQLEEALKKVKPNIMLLQETGLKEDEHPPISTFKTWITRARPSSQQYGENTWGGVAIGATSSVPFYSTSLSGSSERCEVVWSQVNIQNSPPIIIGSTYWRRRSNTHNIPFQAEGLIDNIQQALRKTPLVFLGGDFNIDVSLVNGTLKFTGEREMTEALESIIQQTEMVIINAAQNGHFLPTHFDPKPQVPPTCIDIFLASPSLAQLCSLKVHHFKPDGHQLISIKVLLSSQQSLQRKNSKKKQILFSIIQNDITLQTKLREKVQEQLSLSCGLS